MIRAAVMLAALLATTAANAQESFHYKKAVDPEAGLPAYKRTTLPPPDPIGDIPPGWSLMPAALPSVPSPVPTLSDVPVLIFGGKGGNVWAHETRFAALAHNRQPVEMRGGCWSACTIITSHIPKDRLCFAAGSFLAFHAAQTMETPPRLHAASTRWMYSGYPAEIRQWIDRHGGLSKMTVETYWTMHDRDLWAIGYPKCR